MLEICKYGTEILQTKAELIKNINEKLINLVDHMRLTMYKSCGIGLAAPQVGKPIQLAIVDTTMGEDQNEFLVLINPKIITSEGNELLEEGCLSIPGVSALIKRSTKIMINAFDLSGKEIQQEFEGQKARVIQHEIDHLNGILIIDRLSSLKKQLLKKEIKKLKQNGKW